TAGEIRCDLAAGAEGSIQNAKSVVAREGEVIARSSVACPAYRDNFAAGLNGDGKRLVGASGKVGSHLATDAVARVQAAVAVITDKCKVAAGHVVGCSAPGDNLAVILNRSREGSIISIACRESCSHLAAGPERCIETTVAVVAHQGEVIAGRAA